MVRTKEEKERRKGEREGVQGEEGAWTRISVKSYKPPPHFTVGWAGTPREGASLELLDSWTHSPCTVFDSSCWLLSPTGSATSFFVFRDV